MKKIFLSLAITAIGFVSCYYPLDPVPQLTRYPMAAGNTWNYTRQLAMYNFRATKPGATFRDTAYTFTGRISVLGTAHLPDNSDTWACATQETGQGRTLAGVTYYLETGNSLIMHAYTGGTSLFIPKRGEEQFTIRFANRTFGSLREIAAAFVDPALPAEPEGTLDSIYYEPRPVTSYKFPLTAGKTWDYRLAGFPFHIMKKVIGTDVVAVPAGTFSVWKIEWSWDTNNDGIVEANIHGFDYVGSKGLLKRSFVFSNLLVTGPDGPADTLGYFDSKDESVVTSFHIN